VVKSGSKQILWIIYSLKWPQKNQLKKGKLNRKKVEKSE
jgi:hypothetical protein